VGGSELLLDGGPVGGGGGGGGGGCAWATTSFLAANPALLAELTALLQA
jgi:hypothetical protein